MQYNSQHLGVGRREQKNETILSYPSGGEESVTRLLPAVKEQQAVKE